MKERSRYEQESTRSIAVEILADPKATIRETVVAQRIRNGWGPGYYGRHANNDHQFD